MNIAIIPARGGSKRIPRKNIKPFLGKPMIAWPIEIAKNSDIFDHIIVSSDDSEIIQIANESGAETPFIRPKDLADDLTPTVPVIAQAIEECLKLGITPENVCCIYPGVPFLEKDDLIKAKNLLERNNVDFVYLGAWNFKDVIANKESEFVNKGGQFITHVPKVLTFS